MGAASSISAADSHQAEIDVLQSGRPLAAVLAIAANALGSSDAFLASKPFPLNTDRHPVDPSLPANLDDDFYANLFIDFVVFDVMAHPRHQASLRSLCRAAIAQPHAPAAVDMALIIRASICRIRDYVSAPSAAYRNEEVLGSILFAVRVLDALVEERTSDKGLCLVLGAGPAIPDEDRIDIGQSILWQLITSALDCIASWNDKDGVSSSIRVAAINLIFVALSATYLSPHHQVSEGSDDSLPLAASLSSPGYQIPRNSEGNVHCSDRHKSGAEDTMLRDASQAGSPRKNCQYKRPALTSSSGRYSSSDYLLHSSQKPELERRRNVADPRPAAKLQPKSLLAAIVNRYPRPDAIVTSLLNCGIVAASRREAASHHFPSLLLPASSLPSDRHFSSTGLQQNNGMSGALNNFKSPGSPMLHSSPTVFASNIVASVSKQLALGFGHSDTHSGSSRRYRNLSSGNGISSPDQDCKATVEFPSVFSSVASRLQMIGPSFLPSNLSSWTLQQQSKGDNRTSVDCLQCPDYVSSSESRPASSSSERVEIGDVLPETAEAGILKLSRLSRNSASGTIPSLPTASTYVEESAVQVSQPDPLGASRNALDQTLKTGDRTMTSPRSRSSNALDASRTKFTQALSTASCHMSVPATYLAQQAFSLLSVLCSPEEPSGSIAVRGMDSDDSTCMMSFSQSRSTRGECRDMNFYSISPDDASAETSATDRCYREEDMEQGILNPYRTSLLHLHDLPSQDSGDDSAISFGRLYEALGTWCDDPRAALITYYLVEGNRRFRTFVLSRTDPDVFLVPLLASVYARASVVSLTAPADAYTPAIIILMLTSDAGFCDAINNINLPTTNLPWLADHIRLGGVGISLSGLVMLVCIRCIQQSLVAKRRVMESYLASLCVSIAANVAMSISEISSLAADRLVALIDFIGKRRRRSMLVDAQERSMPLSPPRVGRKNQMASPFPHLRSTHTVCKEKVRETSQALDSELRVEGPARQKSTRPNGSVISEYNTKHVIFFSRCGTEASEADSVDTLSELLGTVLEVVTSILRVNSNIAANKHLMYSLLHKETLFDSSHIRDVSPRTEVLVQRIRRVIRFFSGFLESEAANTGLRDDMPQLQGHAKASQASSPSRTSLATPGVEDNQRSTTQNVRGIAVSVDRVFDTISRCSRKLPPQILGTLPTMRFEYCEALSSSEYFMPYAWILAMQNSPLQWDPTKFPDATIPLSKSVFHPPRPSHGSSRSSAN